MKLGFYLVACLVWVLDFASKCAIKAWLDPRQPVDLIPGYLRLSYVENTGVAFGLFADVQSEWKPYVLAAMAVLAVTVILIYSARLPRRRLLLQVALPVTLGGILGNFVDRVAHGFVVDFVELHLREVFHWPTFNVADSAITIGICLLLIDTVRNPERDGAAEEEAGSA